MAEVKVIYQGGFIPDLGIALSGTMQGWLMFRHPDGQWVTVADLKAHAALFARSAQEPQS